MTTDLKVDTLSVRDSDEDLEDIVDLDDGKTVLGKVSKFISEVVHSEEDNFMTILSTVQKYRLNEFNTIISNAMKNENLNNHISYAKNLKNNGGIEIRV